MSRKIVGILGGMGPEATVDFMAKIIKNTPATIDQEHIRMLVDNNPQVPDRIKAIMANGENPGPVLAEMAKKLEAWGAELLTIPCNTAHYYLEDVVSSVSIPVINMIEQTSKVIMEEGVKTVALLATSGTLKTKLYESKLNGLGIKVIIPSEEYQEKVMQIIYAVKANKQEDVKELQNEVITHVKENGAKAAILGCTELPIAFSNNSKYQIKFYDPTTILAQAVVKAAI